jgi:large subunit ribosomal protein L7/L12
LEDFIMASEKVTAIVESVKTMTVLELKELVDTICSEFGVSAVAAAAPAAGAAAGAAAAEEKTEFDVILKDIGDSKMQVIKTVKELTGASLMDAKKLVETPDAKLKEKASKADAEDIQKKLEAVGAKVELK